jgi:hypothetical protein
MSFVTRLRAAMLCAGLVSSALHAQTVNHQSGFTSPADYQLNGNARLTSSGTVTLTDTGATGEAGSLFTRSRVNVRAFSASFRFVLYANSGGGYADGITFTVQNAAPTALGGSGDDLGYGGIGTSFAVKFDSYQNSGDPSATSLGYFSGGATPIGGNDTSCCVNLRSGHTMIGTIDYDGSTLTVILSDTNANTYYEWIWTNVYIPTLIGGSSLAYVGFTAGTGSSVGTQEIQSFVYRSLPPMVATDLGTLPVQSCNAAWNTLGNAINDFGQVAGQANVCFDVNTVTQHAFLWDPVAGIQDLHTPNLYQGQYYGVSGANAVNLHGEVAGDSWLTVLDSANNPQFVQGGFTWSNGAMSPLSGPSYYLTCAPWQPSGCTPGYFSELRLLGLNDSGTTVGWFYDFDTITHGADVRPAGGGLNWFSQPLPYTRAYAINDYGLAVGDVGDGSKCAIFDTTTSTLHQISAGSGTPQQLVAINSNGAAVGQRNGMGILWTPSTPNGTSGSFTDLFPTVDPSRANGINDADYIVGTIGTAAMVRIPSAAGDSGGVLVSLDDMRVAGLITGGSLPMFYDGRAINNLGQVLVTGSNGHGYLLSPPITPVFTPSPTWTVVGHAAMTVALNGSGFTYGAQVRWNGSLRSATLVSPTQMLVQLSASDFAVRGNFTITVTDPGANTTPGSAVFVVK